MKWAVAITVLAFIHAIFPGYAEGQKIPGQAVEIEADNGIEWNRDQRMYVARGNARAARGGAEIFADELIAYYRGNDAEDKGSGKNNKEGQTIFRVDADGHVSVRSKNNQAYGDQAVYHVEQAVFVLVGKTLRLETARARITAQDSLEHYCRCAILNEAIAKASVASLGVGQPRNMDDLFGTAKGCSLEKLRCACLLHARQRLIHFARQNGCDHDWRFLASVECKRAGVE